MFYFLLHTSLVHVACFGRPACTTKPQTCKSSSYFFTYLCMHARNDVDQTIFTEIISVFRAVEKTLHLIAMTPGKINCCGL